jgi:uncharacterized protein YuzE
MAKAAALNHNRILEDAVAIKYDEEEDILIIYFAENRPCIAYELTEDIIARVDPNTGELVSFEVFDVRASLREKTPADLPKELVGA